MHIKNFCSPDDGGASGAAVDTATETDDLFETVGGPEAEGDEQIIDGISAKNTKDSEGKPLNPKEQVDDEPAVEDFESLYTALKDKYPKELQAKYDGNFNKRFKDAKRNEETLKSLKPLINAMSARYGIDAKDIAALVKAADEDNSNFEKKAFEKGFGDVATYRDYLRREEEFNELREAERRRTEAETQERERSELIKGWLEESAELQKEVPNFDFKTEWNGSEKFRYLINSGFGVAEAYKMLHADEFAKKAAEKAQAEIMREIRANNQRPTENGAGAQAGIRVKKSVDEMSAADIDRIVQEAKSGKKIPF